MAHFLITRPKKETGEVKSELSHPLFHADTRTLCALTIVLSGSVLHTELMPNSPLVHLPPEFLLDIYAKRQLGTCDREEQEQLTGGSTIDIMDSHELKLKVERDDTQLHLSLY